MLFVDLNARRQTYLDGTTRLNMLTDMSKFAAPVLAYTAEDHPNADMLEMAAIGGWRAACRIGDYTEGQKVAYIPEGSLVPWDIIEELGLADPPRLAGPNHNRVKALRLRGVLSQGLVYGGDRIAHLSVGDDAVEALGLTKWVPQIPVHMSGSIIPGPKIDYEIDDIKSWPGRMVPGEDCVTTEKLHGVFCGIGLFQKAHGDAPTVVVSSKGHLSQGRRFDLESENNTDNLYVRIWKKHADAIRGLFTEWQTTGPVNGNPPTGEAGSLSVYLFGEICGPKVQDLRYGLSAPTFHLFDVLVNGAYLDWNDVEKTAGAVNVSTVPVLEVGPWSEGLIEKHCVGKSTMASHMREGIVVRTSTTRYDHGLTHESGRGPGRMILKATSERYLLRKGGTEYN